MAEALLEINDWDEGDRLSEDAAETASSSPQPPHAQPTKIPRRNVAPSQGRSTSFEMYSAEVGRSTPPTQEEEQELIQRFKEGDQQAVNELVARNQRFVLRKARSFNGYGLNIMDLVQEGNLGLLRAAEKFDLTRGNRFITYAAYWIRAYMMYYILRNRHLAIRPTNQGCRKTFFNLAKTRRSLEEEGNHDPSDDELAEKLGVDVEDVRQIQAMHSPVISLDTPLKGKDGEDSAATLGDRLPDLRAKTPEELMDRPDAIRERQGAMIEELLKGLNPREKTILESHRLGEDPKTLKEIGEDLGISRERVRQLEVLALGKLRDRVRRLGQHREGLFTEE